MYDISSEYLINTRHINCGISLFLGIPANIRSLYGLKYGGIILNVESKKYSLVLALSKQIIFSLSPKIIILCSLLSILFFFYNHNLCQ